MATRKPKIITTIAPEAVTLRNPEEFSVEAILMRAVDKGVNVETMERLLAMRRELKAEHAKEAFDSAMARFQAECPTIVKTKEVRGNNGNVAYRYAPIESIVEQVKEPIQRNGFSYKTDQELKEEGVRVTVRVIHEQGHSEETSMEVPFGSKTQIMSQSQVAAAATTFAKRYAFCNAFGILTGDEDTDGASLPATPTARPSYERPAPYKGVVDRDDEPFTKKDPLSEKKRVLSLQLKKLGHILTGMTKAEADALVFKHSGLVPVPANFDEIITRLDVLISEREKVGEPAEEFITYEEPHA